MSERDGLVEAVRHGRMTASEISASCPTTESDIDEQIAAAVRGWAKERLPSTVDGRLDTRYQQGWHQAISDVRLVLGLDEPEGR